VVAWMEIIAAKPPNGNHTNPGLCLSGSNAHFLTSGCTKMSKRLVNSAPGISDGGSEAENIR